jgi:2,4-dienoyl-CoA reductase-like NADH-dependent reductase (Old Yellow Enzyme family)/thioredoxin reductase
LKYKYLFQKGNIGKLELKNRVVMPAIGVSLAKSTGEASDDLIAYYEERAKGGCGLIITEITKIDDEYGAGTANQLSVTKPIHVVQLERLAKTVHKYDSKIFVQLHHPGRQTYSRLIGGKQVVAPSAIMCKRTKEMPRALTTEEVEDLVKKFIIGAKIAQTAGIDGVELHGAHGYLINQFLSEYTNKRTDKYGGSFVNRMRFITEIILGIKHICGHDFPISVRISGDEFVDGGYKIDEAVKIAIYLESIGVNAINVSNGTYESGITIVEPISYPQGWKKHLAKTIKSAIKIPVIAADVIRKPEFAESLLEEGVQDFVAIGRGQLADPEWTNKAYEGKEDEIRPCISCLYCFEELGSGRMIKCAVNPKTGREREFQGFDETGNNRVVAIVGGGPAGMEAARVLAIRGFKPVIFEKEKELGGMLQYGNKPPKKEKITWLIENMAYQLKQLGAEIRLNTEATVDEIKKLNPYAVFIGVGAAPSIPPIPGVNGGHVYTILDILSGKVKLKDSNVAVIGSGLTGLETAELLAEQGNKVSVIEMLSEIGKDTNPSNLFDVTNRLKQYQVEFLPSQRLVEIAPASITLMNMKTQQTSQKAVDAVVLSLGVSSRKELIKEFESHFEKVRVLGDASQPGRIAEATRDGFERAYVLQ